MIVIADSGSSKTDWLVFNNTSQTEIETTGINPLFQNTSEIYKKLVSAFEKIDCKMVKEVHFYGAGCIKGKTDAVVADALCKLFVNASVEVADDMLGAARAMLQNQSGFACILGTGANSCFYNGSEIIDKISPLGFILGDEGSGAHIGKLFLNDYFKRAIPEDFATLVQEKLNPDMANIISAVYRGEYPSRYLATFSKFLGEHKDNNYVKNLIKRSFTEFFFRNIERYNGYKNYKVNFVGSIAQHYSDILKEVAFEREIEIGQILQKPIDALKHFHTK